MKTPKTLVKYLAIAIAVPIMLVGCSNEDETASEDTEVAVVEEITETEEVEAAGEDTQYEDSEDESYTYDEDPHKHFSGWSERDKFETRIEIDDIHTLNDNEAQQATQQALKSNLMVNLDLSSTILPELEDIAVTSIDDHGDDTYTVTTEGTYQILTGVEDERDNYDFTMTINMFENYYAEQLAENLMEVPEGARMFDLEAVTINGEEIELEPSQ